MNLQFGSGVLICTPNFGNTAANPTPTMLGVLQEASVEFKGDLKKLIGQNQFAVATARGKIDVSGKGKAASLDPNALNQLYFGQTATTGGARPITNEKHTTGTTAVALQTTVTEDLGVINFDTGLNMVKVASAPAIGQYSFGLVSGTATYTFASGETASAVLLNYLYTTSTAGSTITLTNQLMGYAPEFEMVLYNYFRTKLFMLKLNCCTMGMVSIPTKQEDFWVCDFDFNANCDATNTLGLIYADTL